MLYREYLGWQKEIFEILRHLKGATCMQIRIELVTRGFNPSKSRVYDFLKKSQEIKKYKIWSYSNEYMYCLEYIEAPKRALIIQYNHVLQAFNNNVKYRFDDYAAFPRELEQYFNSEGFDLLRSNTNSHIKKNKKDPDTNISLWVAYRNKMQLVVLNGCLCWLLFDSQALDSKAYFNRFKIIEEISSILDKQIGVIVVGDNPEKLSRLLKRKYGRVKMEDRMRANFSYLSYISYFQDAEMIEIFTLDEAK